jgi:osmotically-inducible protein OsmY
MSNNELELDVRDELTRDPKVDAKVIAVSAADSVVTLRGTVGSFGAKLAAKRAAERVHGVEKIENHLQVRLGGGDTKPDAKLRADVLQALMHDGDVPHTVDAQVEHGVVTLTGKAEWQFQREEAERVAGNVVGVWGVLDEIVLEDPKPDVGAIRGAIEEALKRDAKIEADELSITSSSGAVTIEGVVGSWSEHDDAISAARAAPGVKHVHDHIEVHPK